MARIYPSGARPTAPFDETTERSPSLNQIANDIVIHADTISSTVDAVIRQVKNWNNPVYRDDILHKLSELRSRLKSIRSDVTDSNKADFHSLRNVFHNPQCTF